VARLVEQIQAGVDVEDNFARLHKRFHLPLRSYFQSCGFSPERSEELTQDVFVQVFRNLASFQHRSRFTTWLFEIAKNLAINERRRTKAAMRDGQEKPLVEELDADDEEGRDAASPLVSGERNPHEEVELQEQVEVLRQALETLPPQMRRCVLLRNQDYKYREIAEIMNIRIDTVKAHLGQARARLQRILTEGSRALKRLSEEPAEPPGRTGPGRPGSEVET
jgi:RNA polymerase sigma-70 factor (ECF subfamily)